jgi:outer membrane immunogenic protein
MENKMTDSSFSRWLIVGALLLTMSGAFARSANAQTEVVQSADQKLLAARIDDASVAALTAVEPAATNATPAPPAPASHSWTGFYVGVNVGQGSSSTTTVSVNPLPSAALFVNLLPQAFTMNPSGVLGGAQAGFNWQHGHFVLGVEADISAADIEETSRESPIIQNDHTPFPGTGNNIVVQQHTDALTTVRPRIGFVLGSRFLLYGTGGLAIAHVGYTASTDFRPVGTTQYNSNFSKTQKGWTAGGGAEVAIVGRWSVKGEYLRYNVGNLQTATVNAIPLLPPFQVNYVWNTGSTDLYRFGLNFRF